MFGEVGVDLGHLVGDLLREALLERLLIVPGALVAAVVNPRYGSDDGQRDPDMGEEAEQPGRHQSVPLGSLDAVIPIKPPTDRMIAGT